MYALKFPLNDIFKVSDLALCARPLPFVVSQPCLPAPPDPFLLCINQINLYRIVLYRIVRRAFFVVSASVLRLAVFDPRETHTHAQDAVRRPGQQKLETWQMMAAGSGAGMVQILLTYPLDLIRTRLQLALSIPGGAPYNGIGHCAVSIFRTEGGAALYKGLGPTLFMGIPYVGMQMTFYARFKQWYAEYAKLPGPEQLPILPMLMCGSAAGLTAQTISFPADTVRHRMQANGINGSEKVYKNTLDCFKKMYQREGMRSFYKGWALNAFRCIPGAAIQFSAYDTLKRLLQVA